MTIWGLLAFLAFAFCFMALVFPPALAAYGVLWRGLWGAGAAASLFGALFSLLLVATGGGQDDPMTWVAVFGFFFCVSLMFGCGIAAIIYRKPAQ